ncbi:MAG TPA: hypothetical protein VMM12_12360 [Longimicrobiales bacterium]|nr:hypothetical protein [Longimicrobiales bacterium]
MDRVTFHHLDRDWEAAIPDVPGDRPVRFRNADPKNDRTYEATIAADELGGEEASDRELALRRGLEAALVLDALSGHHTGLTAGEIADATGMPEEAAVDRLDVLESVQPVWSLNGPRRYRAIGTEED